MYISSTKIQLVFISLYILLASGYKKDATFNAIMVGINFERLQRCLTIVTVGSRFEFEANWYSFYFGFVRK